MLVITQEVTDKALVTLVMHKLRGTLDVCAVQLAGNLRLDDIVKVTGGRVLHDLREDALKALKREDFGRARRITVGHDSTLIDGGAGVLEEADERLHRRFRTQGANDFGHWAVEEHVSQLGTRCMAVLEVGAATETERKSRVEHARHAVRALRTALNGGSVPGGGLALLRCRPALDALPAEGDERLGMAAVRRALEEPFRQLVTNHGQDADAAVLEADAREAAGIPGIVATGGTDAVGILHKALQEAADGASSLLKEAVSQMPSADVLLNFVRPGNRFPHSEIMGLRTFAAPRWSEDPDEGSVISRYPSIDTVAPLRAGEYAMFLVDLLLLHSGSSAPYPFVFSGLDERWTTLHVSVELQSEEADFGPSGSSGVLEVRRNGNSVPARLVGRVLPGHSQVHVRAIFSCDGRFCGEARRSFPVEAPGGLVTAGVSPPPTESTRGGFAFEPDVTPPDLTVFILGLPGSPMLRWYLQLADRHTATEIYGMPVSLREDICLDQGDWQQWSLSLLDDFANKKSGSHLRLVQGIGQALFNKAPAVFKQAYFALRDRLGESFSIQFVTDGPFIPWELMQPVDGRRRYPLLMMEHPVARWLAEYGGRPRGQLGHGEAVSIAPSYAGRSPQVQALPAALEQSRALLATLKALGIPAREQKALTEEVFELLEERNAEWRHRRKVALLHFAGHGVADARKPEAARLLLDDADLLAAEVQREEVMLGLRSGTFVFFSACSVGLDGSRVLGSPAGWPQAFIHRGFRGFLAPISRIWEEEAALFTEAFLKEAFERRQPVGHALRNVRRQLGEQHSSCLAFMYYGDVMARFQHDPRRG